MIRFEKNHPHRAGLDYVVKAINPKHSNEALLLLKSDGYRIYATSGHNLHFYIPEACPLPAGLYKIIENTKKSLGVELVETDLSYPNVDRVLPKQAPTHTFISPSEGGKLAEVIRATPGGKGLQLESFKNAISDPSIINYLPGDGLSPVVFQGVTLTAVIMPIRA